MTRSAVRSPVLVRETHTGVVVLVGDHAYKVRKPLGPPGFPDLRGEARRRAVCRKEIELNRRLAPDVYEDLAEVARPETGSREPVIVMRRMPDEMRLSTLITAGGDVHDHVRAVARLLSGFHNSAARSGQISVEGSAARLRYRWLANLRDSRRFCPDLLGPAIPGAVERLALRYVDGRGRLFDARVRAGLIVDGHGDLVAEDIFCLPDYPRVLDCIEFDDRLRWVDVLEDAATLAMDLERLGRPDLGQRFLEWYEQFSAVPVTTSLSHHYIAYRAFVRARAACLHAEQGEPGAALQAARAAELALGHLQAGEVRLVLVGGPAGSGKSTVAAALADEFGYALLSADALRREAVKRRAYPAPAVGDAVYQGLLDRARRALAYGESVVIDASWDATAWRSAAGAAATETVSRLVRLHCQAPAELAASRARERHSSGRRLTDIAVVPGRRVPATAWPDWPGAADVDTSGPVESALESARRAISG